MTVSDTLTLAKQHQQAGRLEEADTLCRQVLLAQPHHPEAYYRLGRVLHNAYQLDEAVRCYRLALALNPDDAETYYDLGLAFKEQGKVTEAETCYRQALARQSSDGVKVSLATILPVIVPSAQDVSVLRRTFEDNIDALLQTEITLRDPSREVGQTNFYLAYHGQNDRALQLKMAHLYARACPALSYTAPHCAAPAHTRKTGTITIGFCSHFFHNHTVGELLRGIMAQLSRQSFSVIIFTFARPPDQTADFIAQHADRVVVLPPTLEEARDRIAQETLDILVYPDIGMDPITYCLAFSRLAPVQCATWAHPVTTGIATLDYFLSSQDLEPDDADGHYSERLVRLKHLPTYYYRPEQPLARKSRKDFGIGGDGALYLCPQSLFKIHPDCDDVFGAILRADPQGQVLLIEGHAPHWTELLTRRFRAVIPDVLGRIRFMPRMTHAEFQQLLACADVMLDPLHWSGGRTTLEALALGLPIVTLPGKLMRGRVTYACYKQMGVMDCVASTQERYVELAVRLGTERTCREGVTAKILAANAALFENGDAVLEMERFFREALEVAPTAPMEPEAHNALGTVFYGQGKLDEAMACYRQAVALNPAYAEAHSNLGNVLRAQGKLDEAVACYRHALTLTPTHANAYYNLGQALHEQSKLEDAVRCYRLALALTPEDAAAHYSLGFALHAQDKLDEAMQCYRRALALTPESMDALNNLGNVLHAQGKLDEAMACYRRALALKPGEHAIHSNLLMTMSYDPSSTPAAVFAEHQNWNLCHARPLAPLISAHQHNRDSERRLRIGYVSADFDGHPIGLWMEPLIAAHCRSDVEIVCYSAGTRSDETTDRLKASADVWRTITTMTDKEVAHLVASDQVDILVDLSGHTGHHRLLVFAHKPAPIQVTYLGSLTTTGISAMDYKLTDHFLTPPDSQEQFTEELIRLPGCFACYQAPSDAPTVTPLPSLRTGHVTFSSFNNPTKVTAQVVAVWATILHAVPESRMLLNYWSFEDQGVQARYRALFASHGIAADRLDLLPGAPFPDHLALYERVDLALDSFPYNGCYTSSEALWMGIPIITLAGHMSYSRYGVTLLANLGLEELIATTTEEYVAKAVALANDRVRLAALRQELRTRMASSPLCDASALAHAIEEAYRAMWRRWCTGALA